MLGRQDENVVQPTSERIWYVVDEFGRVREFESWELVGGEVVGVAEVELEVVEGE